MPLILEDLITVIAHLAAEANRTAGTSWTDSVAVGLLINPLVYRLYAMRVRIPHRLHRESMLQESFRIAALLFVARTKWHTVFISSLINLQAANLKDWIGSTKDNDWKGFEALKAWVLVIGATHSRRHSEERLWFLTEILSGWKRAGCATLSEYLAQVKGFLWIEDLFESAASEMWRDLRMLS